MSGQLITASESPNAAREEIVAIRFSVVACVWRLT